MTSPIDRTGLRRKFWQKKPLSDLSKQEWEALCDGCGKCCLLKLEDEDTGTVHYTDVACRLFDAETCTCGNYPLRKQMVAGCVVLTPENIERNAHWMPRTCAYRLLQEGDKLPGWHPIITGDAASTDTAGMSVTGRTVAEYEVAEEDLEDHVLKGFVS
ncbi:MAG: YcgN family cysteine cluster protein [Rhodobacteraceae bacterium]|nr:YcgN family cysteine cluster protein [Paracoccaceae bacterium]